MKNTMIAIDVGGTNTRILIATEENGKVVILWTKERRIKNKEGLKAFIRKNLCPLSIRGNATKCVIGFAGTIAGRREARMTNWKGNDQVSSQDLAEWGLPEKNICLLNDMESAGYGLLYLASEKERMAIACEAVYGADQHESTSFCTANRILIVPGTGLGTSAIVAMPGRGNKLQERPIASEIQHAASSPLDVTHERIIHWFRKKKGFYPSWEDFTSGQGLKEIYEGICAIRHVALQKRINWTSGGDPAGIIASAAVYNKDAQCAEALDLYYGCAGRVAQLLALAFQPYKGVFLGGKSTFKNATFIRNSRFVMEFQNNLRQKHLLIKFPIFILREELNLLGNLWACRHNS